MRSPAPQAEPQPNRTELNQIKSICAMPAVDIRHLSTASASFEVEFQRVLHWSAETDDAIEQRVAGAKTAQLPTAARLRGPDLMLQTETVQFGLLGQDEPGNDSGDSNLWGPFNCKRLRQAEQTCLGCAIRRSPW